MNLQKTMQRSNPESAAKKSSERVEREPARSARLKNAGTSVCPKSLPARLRPCSGASGDGAGGRPCRQRQVPVCWQQELLGAGSLLQQVRPSARVPAPQQGQEWPQGPFQEVPCCGFSAFPPERPGVAQPQEEAAHKGWSGINTTASQTKDFAASLRIPNMSVQVVVVCRTPTGAAHRVVSARET